MNPEVVQGGPNDGAFRPNPMRDDRLGGGLIMQQQEEFRNPDRPFGFQGSLYSASCHEIANDFSSQADISTNLGFPFLIL